MGRSGDGKRNILWGCPNEEKKCYEDREVFSAQKEVSECDQIGILQ